MTVTFEFVSQAAHFGIGATIIYTLHSFGADLAGAMAALTLFAGWKELVWDRRHEDKVTQGKWWVDFGWWITGGAFAVLVIEISGLWR